MPRRADWLGAGALLIACALAYGAALPASFQFDDWNVIVNFAPVHGLGAWFDALPAIRPLLKLSYTLNHLIDPGPLGFRLVNDALHLANTALVFWIFDRMGRGHVQCSPGPLMRSPPSPATLPNTSTTAFSCCFTTNTPDARYATSSNTITTRSTLNEAFNASFSARLPASAGS